MGIKEKVFDGITELTELGKGWKETGSFVQSVAHNQIPLIP